MKKITKLLSILLIASLLFAFCACIPTLDEQLDDQQEELPVTFQVTYIAGQGGRIVGQADQTVEQGKDATGITAVADDGYMFEKWSDGLTSPIRQDLNVQANIALTATFTRIPEPDPQSITFNVDYKFGVVDNPIAKVTFNRDNVSETDLPVPTREHFTFGGWYLGETQVSDDTGAILVGNEIIESDESVIYAKWTANETFTYKILIVYVTRVQDSFLNCSGSKVSVDFTMGEQEERLWHATTSHLKLYLDELLDGLVDFQVDEYFTTEVLTAKYFTASGGSGQISQMLDAHRVPEILEKADEYDNVVCVYGMQPNPKRTSQFQLQAGFASAKYAAICWDQFVYSMGICGISLSEATECLENHTESEFYNSALYVEIYWINNFVHELAHAIEMRVGLRNYHAAVPSQTAREMRQQNKAYYFSESLLNGEKVGIPYDIWAGNIAKISFTNKVNGDNGFIRVSGNCGSTPNNEGVAFYEALYGSEITITSAPHAGYKLDHWSDGVTTPTRTDTITGDMTLTAFYELAEYTISVYPSEGGVISGYFEENRSTVWINNQEFTGTVKKGYTGMFVSARALDGYRFVGWSNGETNYQLNFTLRVNTRFPSELFDETYTLILIPIFEKIEE